jgi:hypothetical protein
MTFYAKQSFWVYKTSEWVKISFWKFLWMWFVGELENDPYLLRIEL